MAAEFDVFLSYNRLDAAVVETIGRHLQASGLTVWLDKWELRPGMPWQPAMEHGLRSSRAVAVCVGGAGLGTWQNPEMQAALNRAQREQIPVIPVLLPGSPDTPQLALFLEQLTWVDLRPGLSADGLARLRWGITGIRSEPGAAPVLDSAPATAPVAGPTPGPPADEDADLAGAIPPTDRRWPRPLRPRHPLDWALLVTILSTIIAVAAWLWPMPPLNERGPKPPPTPARPAVYSLRVEVVDPAGYRLSDAQVGASVGGETLQSRNGDWQLELPAARLPADGTVTVWAKHRDWETASAPITLATDPNPHLTLRLQPPSSWLRGHLIDRHQRGVPGVRVSLDDGTPGSDITGAGGNFALHLPLPADRPVQVRAKPATGKVEPTFCYTGRDSCELELKTP